MLVILSPKGKTALRSGAALGFAPIRLRPGFPDRLKATLVGDRYAELRKAVREIGGAVERIDDP